MKYATKSTNLPLVKNFYDRFEVVPVGLEIANSFVRGHHSYMSRVHRCKYSLGLTFDKELVGVIICNVPSSPHYDDGRTLEILRCAIAVGWPHAASKLIGQACRVARAMGYKKVITWCDAAKSGTSYVATNFKLVKISQRSHWKTRPAKREEEPSSQMKLFELSF